MRKKLILTASRKMDNNKKQDRNEDGLIRMAAAVRDYMGFHDDQVKLWPVGSTEADRSISLEIFHAFGADIKELKKNIKSGKIDKGQYERTGFVTTETFHKICGEGNKLKHADNIWISDDIHDTVIGADPEFLIFGQDGTVVPATNILPHIGEIGSDGAMAEIRPLPEVSVDKLVRNMREIFENNVNKGDIKDYKLIATCYHEDGGRGYPVGGHIHVGNPIQLVNKSSDVKRGFYKVTNKILDEYLTVPLIKLDGPNGAGRRSNKMVYSGYGYFGDFRTNHGRLEHRSLSGIWLLHPSVSKAVLGTAKAITDEAFKLISAHKFAEDYILPYRFADTNMYNTNFKSWDKIPLAADMGCTKPSKWMINMLKKSDEKTIDHTHVKKLHNKLKSLSTFEDNRKYIDGLCEILKLKYEETSKWDRDIRENWLGNKKFLIDL